MRHDSKRIQALSLLRTALVCQIVAFLAVGTTAFANPVLQEVVSGTVEVQPGGDSVNVTNGSIANWQQFDIGATETFDVNFIAGHEGGNHLARVLNGLETQILGALTSNGHVYVVNPAGIVVGATGSIDMPGFHAAAGDALVTGNDAFRARRDSENLVDGGNQYVNLTGAVLNFGRINARVVDLVGRYVVNAGVITSDRPSGPDGYFVLAVGNDIIIRRSTPEEPGRTSIQLIIQGLAPAVLAALDDAPEPGVALVKGADLFADDGSRITAGRIDAGDGGTVKIGAGLALGAGDLFGSAIQFDSGTEVNAREIHAEAGGHDLKMAGRLHASDVQLCAGASCGNLDGIDIVNVQTGPDRRDRVEFSAGESSIVLRELSAEDRNGEDGIENTEDDRAARLRVESDGSSTIDPLEMGLETPGHLADLRFGVAAGDLTLRGNFAARDFAARTSSAGQGFVALAFDPDALPDDEPLTTITTETAVLSAPGGEVRGLAEAALVQRASSRNADPETGLFEFQSLRIQQGESMVIDADTAASLSDPGRRLELLSSQELRIESGVLRAAELELGAGTTGEDNLIIGSSDEGADTLTLAADTIALRAGPGIIDDSSVIVEDNASFESTNGHRVESFLLEQDSAIDASVFLDHTRLEGDGDDIGEVGYQRTYASNFGSVVLDAPAATKLFGEADAADGVYSDPELDLTLLGDVAGRNVNEVRVETDLQLRSISLGTGAVFTLPTGPGLLAGTRTEPRAQNVVLGNITTELDQVYKAGVELGEDGGLAGDQKLMSTRGRVLFEGALNKNNPGSLTIAAGSEIVPPLDGLGLDEMPIVFEGDVDVANGNLDIVSSFQMSDGSLMQVRGAGGENGILTLGEDGNAIEGQFTQERPGRQRLSADVLVVSRDTTLKQVGGGALVLEAERTLLVAGNVSSEHDADAFPVEDPDPDAEVVTIDSLVELRSQRDLIVSGTVEADVVNVLGAREGEGTTFILHTARINADSLVLSGARDRLVAADVNDTLPENGRVLVQSGALFRGKDTGDARSVEINADLLDAALLPNLEQFVDGTVEPGGFDYRVSAQAQALVIDDVFAAKLEGGGLSDELRVTVSSALGLRVESDLTARELTLQSGLLNGDSLQAGRDLIVGDFRLNADQIELIAGVEPIGIAQTATVMVDSGATFRDTDGGTEGPDGFRFEQETRIETEMQMDGTNPLPELAAFGNLPSGGMDYTVVSTGSDAGIVVDEGVAGRLSNENIALVLLANGDVQVQESLTLRTFEVLAGGDGTGTLTIGDDGMEDVVLTAGEITLRAGVGPRALDTMIPDGQVIDTAEVVIEANARFVGADGALPDTFAILQDGAIDDTTLPELSQFGAAPQADLSGMAYELRSERGAIALSEASRISGSDLTLGAGDGIELMLGQELVLDALTVGGQIDDDAPEEAVLALHQSVKATSGNVDVQRDVSFVAGSEARGIAADTGAMTIDGAVTHRGGGALNLVAEGAVAVSGLIDTGFLASLGPESPDRSAEAGGSVHILGDSITVSAIRTQGFAADSGDVELTADANETITIDGTRRLDVDIDAAAEADFKAGDVTLSAREIVLGSATTRNDIIKVEGANVIFGGSTTVIRSENADAGASDPRELVVVASNGRAFFGGGVEVDNLTVDSTAFVESDAGNGTVTFVGPLNIGGAESGGVGKLNVNADRDVLLLGNVSAENVRLRAGLDDDGSVRIADLSVPIIVAANDVELIAGDGVIHAAGGVADRVDTGTASFRGADGVEGTAPSSFVVVQEAGFADVGGLLSRARADTPEAREGQRIGLVSTLGEVEVDGSDFTGARVRLGAANRVTVTNGLDVIELEFDSDATIESGDVRVRGLTAAPGFIASGDVDVEAGSLLLTTRARFDGTGDQTVTVSGTFDAPAIERAARSGGLPDGDVLTINAAQTRLRGSLRGNVISSGLVSAQIDNGSVVFNGPTLALGDVSAEQDLTFIGELSLTEQTDGGVVGFDQVLSAGGADSTVPEPDPEPEPGMEVTDPAPGEQVTSSGTVTVNNAIVKEAGGLRISGLGPDGGYRVNGAVDDPDSPFDVSIQTEGDLVLEGDGVLVGDGDPLVLRSTGGDLGATGSLTYDGDLMLEVGDSHTLRTAPVAGNDTAITASSLRLAGDVAGAGGLAATATEGDLTLEGDVMLDSTAVLALQSGASGELVFGGAEEIHHVEAGSVELNMAARAASPVSTITRRGGGLDVRATHGNLSIGEKLTSEGDLRLSSTGTTTVSDLTADNIVVSGSGIAVTSRPGGPVLLPGGSMVSDGRADIIGNSVFFSTTPGGSVTIGTPTTSEISDSLVADNVVNRRIFANGRRLTAADLSCGDGVLCDGVARGGARFAAGRQVTTPRVPVDPAGFAALGEFNRAGVGSRPLWAQELVAYLEDASLGGDKLVADTGDPRLRGEPVQKALRIYRGLFAPVSQFDEATGTQTLRSHHGRIRDALQLAEDAYVAAHGRTPTPEAYAAFLGSDYKFGEAQFYLGSFADLVEQAELAGVVAVDLVAFRELLVEGVAPTRLGTEGLAEAF